MQILAFRITNFRSIVDTGWINLSQDNLSALVGQNESGKTAVLSALAATFSSESLHTDDVRQDAPLPVVWLKTKYTPNEIGTMTSIEFVDASATHANSFGGLVSAEIRA